MPSPLMTYPRPPRDTGWGFHDSAGTEARPQDQAGFARRLRQELGITWFKALVAGTNKVDLVERLTCEGIEVIVRLYTRRPHPHHVVSPADVRAYVNAGAHYIEWGNEPNLREEWDEVSWDEGAQVDKVCEQFLRNADAIRQGGGIPLLPAPTPGGHYPHRAWFRTTFEWLRLHNHLRDLEGAALAIHNRPVNHPLSYIDDTGVFFLDYEWIDDLVCQYVGHSLPLLGTEGGYEPGWDQDANYPRIDLARHAEYNVEILRCFGPHGSRRWRDALFCVCMWIVDHFGHPDFAFAAWFNNPDLGGANLPAVDKLREEWRVRPFVREFSWGVVQPDYPAATWRDSPNANPRPAGVRPSLVVLHATGEDFNPSMSRLRDPQSRTSLHYLVSRSGQVYQLVQEGNRAWHAGDAIWNGRPQVDDFSLAVGLVNRNDGSEGFPAAQLEAAAMLVRHLVEKHALTADQVITSSMLRGQAAPDPVSLDLAAFRARLGQVAPLWPPDDVVRQAAWQAANIAYNPEAAFPRYAREHDLGNPETPEFDFEFGGRFFRGQGFSGGIVFAEIGKWHDIQLKPW